MATISNALEVLNKKRLRALARLFKVQMPPSSSKAELAAVLARSIDLRAILGEVTLEELRGVCLRLGKSADCMEVSPRGQGWLNHESVWSRSGGDIWREAIGSLLAGSNRAAIILAWNALVYDFLEKLEYCAVEYRDRSAGMVLGEWESVRRESNYGAAWKLERAVPSTMKDQGYIDEHDEVRLNRLLEDRSKCAHPSIGMDGYPFEFSRQEALAHMMAVQRILESEPSAGKGALARLVGVVDSKGFPATPEQAQVVLGGTALSKPRRSLLRGFVLALLSGLRSMDKVQQPNHIVALQAVHLMHPDVLCEIGRDAGRRVQHFTDDEAPRLIRLLSTLSWIEIDDGVRVRLRLFVESMNERDDDFPLCVAFGLGLSWCKSAAERRMSELDEEQYVVAAKMAPSSSLVCYGLDLIEMGYENERIVQALVSMRQFFDRASIEHLLDLASSSSLSAVSQESLRGVMEAVGVGLGGRTYGLSPEDIRSIPIHDEGDE